MRDVRSGTTIERIVRWGLVVLLIAGFAAAYLLDGHYGYAENNVRQLYKSLGRPTDTLPEPDPDLTADRGRRLAETIPVGGPATALVEDLGDPAIRHQDDLYFLGPGGHLRVSVKHGRITSATWVPGIHDEADQAMQRGIGYALAALALVLLIQLMRVLRTRASVGEDGLRVGRVGPIPFEAIRDVTLDAVGDAVRVEYDEGGQRRSLRLDGYMLRRLDAIVAALCTRTGLPNPLPPNSPDPPDSL